MKRKISEDIWVQIVKRGKDKRGRTNEEMERGRGEWR